MNSINDREALFSHEYVMCLNLKYDYCKKVGLPRAGSSGEMND